MIAMVAQGCAGIAAAFGRRAAQPAPFINCPSHRPTPAIGCVDDAANQMGRERPLRSSRARSNKLTEIEDAAAILFIHRL